MLNIIFTSGLLPIDSLNKAIRIMPFKDNETPSEHLFKNKLIFLTQAKFMFLLTNKQIPECIDNIFTTNSRTGHQVRNTKIGHNFVPLFRTKLKEIFSNMNYGHIYIS